MNRNDMRKVDLHLLIIFEVLMLERNLTRAAEKLFLGQPAISHALSRLRDFFNDQLLIRTGRTMEPTKRALEIFEQLRPALDAMSNALSYAQEFNPATSKLTLRIGLSDDVECGLLPPLLNNLREEAPNLVIVIRRTNFLLMPSQLESGEISVGVGYVMDLPANAKCRTLRLIDTMVLRADDRPGLLTLDEYCCRPHALVSFSGDLNGNIDRDFERIGRTRNVVLAVPQFNGLRSLLAGSELLATVPDYAAAELVSGGGLRAEPAPFDISQSKLSMVWSSAQDNDCAERWLRAKIVEFMGNDSH
ncbi:LysR family transcriptional regulator [Pseudomonas sp. EL_65y_Pfl2_R95]|uniref:LysR family transcriptional regulator n=1 Tax=Pseudomonas sp. EL_65y_Pfl2_R95 TaxID=3088698 RepID=UPI0030DB50C8